MVQVVAALIWRDNRFMICQRPEYKARGLLWEFVGGKVARAGPEKRPALVRECREELDVQVEVDAYCKPRSRLPGPDHPPDAAQRRHYPGRTHTAGA